ncbi:AEC family transporter [Marinomonas aquiplantarum]|uniref:Permease n=1 Tax=Marinomonas aquiplantarum TaxID=491951 RepID=A0A366CUT9_9GAMM|nr:AEC family transporter [Marinomonas aquiplantarum]RBO78508.1 hypothetical protein DFP76_11538 [Marinomonas aquiplantarum]
MFSISLSILPIFALLMLGAFCQRWRFPMEGFWQGVDKLTYWLLFPALLFANTSQIDFSNGMLASYALILLLALAVTAVFVFSITWLMQIEAPTASSMLQAGVRFNTFIVLAVAGSVYGDEGLVLAVLGGAILVPSINVFLVISMVIMHGSSSGKDHSLPKLLTGALIRNPLILAIALGVSLNLMGLTPILVISDVANMLAKSALPMVLLAVGASVRMDAIRSVGATFWLSAGARFFVFPASIILACWWLDVTGLPALVAVLFGFVPTATSAYALARQLGGDADKMAAYITLQILMSILTLPICIWLSQLLIQS